MPRPGTRPYECLRRAWHSDRHQPIRGFLIKDIFRIAHEIHSPATKKNKEWQEKLPIVVLKAEEIMYSKANSEAEYMDPKTLWERLNDAIDTIIRRDESDETGEFLHPCIEAALNLGCIPRRALRSQRNANPRFYLGAYNPGRRDGALKPSSSPFTSQCSNFLNPATLDSNILGNDPPRNRDFCLLNADINTLPLPNSLGSSSFSAYPLCYGTYPQPEPQPVFVALPTMVPKPSFPCDKQLSTMITEDQPEKLVCDLSLRLAPLSVSAPRTYPAASSKEPPLCTWANSDPALGLPSAKMMDSETRKRRAVEMVDDQQASLQPKLLCTFSAGTARIAGL